MEFPYLERRGQARVGTAEDNEVVLDPSHLKTKIAPYHCIFRRNGEIVTVEALGENLVQYCAWECISFKR